MEFEFKFDAFILMFLFHLVDLLVFRVNLLLEFLNDVFVLLDFPMEVMGVVLSFTERRIRELFVLIW